MFFDLFYTLWFTKVVKETVAGIHYGARGTGGEYPTDLLFSRLVAKYNMFFLSIINKHRGPTTDCTFLWILRIIKWYFCPVTKVLNLMFLHLVC